jgi:hypothetical protein
MAGRVFEANRQRQRVDARGQWASPSLGPPYGLPRCLATAYDRFRGPPMTPLMQQAVAAVAALPAAEQDALAARLLAELAAEDEFDRRLLATGGRLAGLAATALAEHRAGETADLDPDEL